MYVWHMCKYVCYVSDVNAVCMCLFGMSVYEWYMWDVYVLYRAYVACTVCVCVCVHVRGICVVCACVVRMRVCYICGVCVWNSVSVFVLY